ncbi:MAG: SAM-dependent methyltransferase [Burkholderiales bacterium]|nr:SAM-dependent methyltransferase [Burkholderiales bacterium]
MFAPVSDWVQRYQLEIPANAGPVLDLACGGGRHARFLRGLGYDVYAVDRDTAAFSTLRAQGITCLQHDLESSKDGLDQSEQSFHWPFEPEQFAGIVICNYLHRPLMPSILASIKDGGSLIYETFAVGNERYGRPRNPRFLLKENELLEHFVFAQRSGWHQHCLAFESGFVNRGDGAVVQRICVRILRDAISIGM